MMGFLTGLLKNLTFIGYNIVEAFVFYLAFNWVAPQLTFENWSMPITHLDYFTCLAIFILIHFIGGFIQKLIPSFK